MTARTTGKLREATAKSEHTQWEGAEAAERTRAGRYDLIMPVPPPALGSRSRRAAEHSGGRPVGDGCTPQPTPQARADCLSRLSRQVIFVIRLTWRLSRAAEPRRLEAFVRRRPQKAVGRTTTARLKPQFAVKCATYSARTSGSRSPLPIRRENVIFCLRYRMAREPAFGVVTLGRVVS